jgi:hypothetical protein
VASSLISHREAFADPHRSVRFVLRAALRHANDAHPGLIDMAAFPALAAHAARLEALPVFREISQPFIAPARD